MPRSSSSRDRQRGQPTRGLRRTSRRRQRQFIEQPVVGVPDASLAPILAWACRDLGRSMAVADLAARAAVSPATPLRRFQAEVGATPLAWPAAERVTLACRLIEQGERRLERARHAVRPAGPRAAAHGPDAQRLSSPVRR
jgi:transcriptional regulator GlxA family with amidase domain